MSAPRRLFSIFAVPLLVPILAATPLLAHAAGTAQQAQATPKPGDGREAAAAKLPIGPLRVNVRSWNGRPIAAPRAAPTNPRFPMRGRDPMGVAVAGAQPGTKISLLRQRRSKDVVVPKCVGDCSVLRDLAAGAEDYVEMVQYTSTNASANQIAAHEVREPKQVAWPNSRVLIKATSRDGQKYEDVAAVVEGLQQQNEARYDVGTNAIANTQISGRLLPSARAWIKASNLYVSEPTVNRVMIKEGEKLLKEVETLEAEHVQLGQNIQGERTKQGAPVDQVKIKGWTDRMAAIQPRLAEKAKAQQMIDRGKKITVQIASVGATPAATPIRTVNTRLAGENGPGVVHTVAGTTEARHGFVTQEVEAIHDDEIRTFVNFTATGNALTSAASVAFRVPQATAQPAFEMGGVKYYRVTPTDQVQTHDPDPAQ